jgi:hypothetical protein
MGGLGLAALWLIAAGDRLNTRFEEIYHLILQIGRCIELTEA